MASIEGLTEEQCERLAAIHVGDFILIASSYKYNEEDGSDEGSEADSDAEEDGEDEVGEDGEEGAAEAASNEEGQEAEHVEDVDVAAGEGDEVEENDEGIEEEDEEDEELPPLTTGLYIVLEVNKDDNDEIIDIVLEQLEYNSKPGQLAGPHRPYQIYGTQVEVSTTTSPISHEQNDTKKMSIKYLIDNANRTDSFYINPTGDDVRRVLHPRHRCPARCHRGWISTQQEMHELVEEDITIVTEHQPVCPVCMGKALMQEYQSLREILESGPVDIGVAIEFHGRLNPRRRDVGYRFKQFDEREWGYLFEDMDSEDSESDHGGAGNTNGWGYWPEALDPAANPVKHPASDAVIASLPRKTFAEAKMQSEETKCPVCRDEFVHDAAVIELPCKHLFCDTGCIEAWLKEWNSCPSCRAKLPSKEDEEMQAKLEVDADSVLNEGEHDTEGQMDDEEDEAEENTPKAKMDVFSSDDSGFDGDRDVVMTDVEDLEED